MRGWIARILAKLRYCLADSQYSASLMISTVRMIAQPQLPVRSCSGLST